jgi:hypothetical protein
MWLLRILTYFARVLRPGGASWPDRWPTNSTLHAENRSVSACDDSRELGKNLPNYPAA